MISILKVTEGNNSAKRYNFHTNHIQNYKGAYNGKKCRRSNSSLSKSGLVILLFVPKFVQLSRKISKL